MSDELGPFVSRDRATARVSTYLPEVISAARNEQWENGWLAAYHSCRKVVCVFCTASILL